MGKIVASFAFIIAVTVVGFAEPTLTVEQQLRVERINLVNQVAQLEKENLSLRQQLTTLQVQIETDRLKREVEQGNPGFVWDPITGKFEAKEP